MLDSDLRSKPLAAVFGLCRRPEDQGFPLRELLGAQLAVQRPPPEAQLAHQGREADLGGVVKIESAAEQRGAHAEARGDGVGAEEIQAGVPWVV